ncbi:MAG: helix-turn-helix transcriptional regulator [Clostridia bacterium]|nr:helix-turn-helix transcriptional regulator [Clostridia bacterium]
MFPEKLKQLRVNCALTQKQVAEVLNIDRSTYTYYETGKSSPTIETLIKLSKIFAVSIDTLLDYESHTSESVATLNDVYTGYVKKNSPGKIITLDEGEKTLLLTYRLLDEESKNNTQEYLKKLLNDTESK